MKKTAFNDELRSLSQAQLFERLNQLRKERFELQLNAVNGRLKDFSQLKEIRKKIARCMSFLNEQRHR